jgi:predicted transcriptional regulator YheO
VNRSAVVVSNGELSGRRIGDPATEFMREILVNDELRRRDYIVDFESRARNGALFRSSLLFLRDGAGDIAAMISVNVELSRLFQARDLFDRLTRTSPPGGRPQPAPTTLTSSELAITAIDAELAAVGIHVSAMLPADKLRVVQNLHARGIFRLRGVVPRVARALQLSEPSVYRYLGIVKATASRRDGSETTGTADSDPASAAM